MMLGKLIAKHVISRMEKEMIESKPLQSKRMEHFVDNIIMPSLENKVGIKFKGFLEVLEESGDATLIDMAKKLGAY